MKIGFFGIGALGLNILKEILSENEFKIEFIVTNSKSDFIKKIGKKYIIPVFIVTMKDDLTETLYYQLLKFKVDLILVSGFHRLLPKSLLDLPNIACVNIHFGKLPKWKGPISWRWAIIKGYKRFYVTFHLMTEKFDVGPIIFEKSICIGLNDRANDVFVRCIKLAKQNIVKVLNNYLQENVYSKQVLETDEYFSYLKQDEITVDKKMSTIDAYNLIRGTFPKPLAEVIINNKLYKIINAKIVLQSLNNPYSDFEKIDNNKFLYKCKDGVLEITVKENNNV